MRAARRGSGRRARPVARAARSAGTAARRAAAARRGRRRIRPPANCRGRRSRCRRKTGSRRNRACYLFPMWTVAQLGADLAAGRTSSRELVEQALARIGEPSGEGRRAFLKVYADAARADADYSDRLRKAGARRSAIDGLPVALKDLFDVAGDVTRAGSKVRETAKPARSDAAAVARLRAAGAVFIGRTN